MRLKIEQTQLFLTLKQSLILKIVIASKSGTCKYPYVIYPIAGRQHRSINLFDWKEKGKGVSQKQYKCFS